MARRHEADTKQCVYLASSNKVLIYSERVLLVPASDLFRRWRQGPASPRHPDTVGRAAEHEKLYRLI